ncbi:MAG: DTW domain-containing protein [Pseudomonadales bacterium]
MKILLLTHEREINRATNTGSLAIESSKGLVERIIWERTKPNRELTKLIESNEALLLYAEGEPSRSTIENYENIVIIDGTWQEARKMFNKSPYLKQAPQSTLALQKDSAYTLRRNQPAGGLCTIECIIEVLKIKGQQEMASELTQKFVEFNNQEK